MNPPNKDVLRDSIRTIRQLTEKLQRYEGQQHADIAIVGIACRFPGAADLDAFWPLLRDGGVATGEVGRDRWDNAAFVDPDYAAAGKVVTPYAGLIDDIYDFDAEFFGLAEVEAEPLDPQQRLLLENSWLALEDAGVDIAALRGSRTGVFVGIGSNDYGSALMSDAAQIDAYVASGNSLSMAAGRLSYFYDFNGPSLAIDTACSSSLVAVDEACRRLRLGECELALAAGVNSLLTPQVSINFSRARMLTDRRQCHVFDARANGYVRGEGCAVLVLKRLPDALRDVDRLHALIKGSSVNHDGRSSGLTVPNGSAQEAVIRAALRQAGVAPQDVTYVEAHGTGTSLGDPIEANALARVYAAGTPRGPLFVGSVKANIGHLEAAAGIAGLIKAVLIVGRGVIPPQPGFGRLNPKIEWDSSTVQIAGTCTVLERGAGDAPLYAGVSSFGFSGTNAHVIVATPPPAAVSEAAADAAQLVVVSGRSPASLQRSAAQVAAYLQQLPAARLAQASYSSTRRRSHAPLRIAAVGTRPDQLAQALRRAADACSDAERPRPRIALLLCARDEPAALEQALHALQRPPAPAAAFADVRDAAGIDAAGQEFASAALHRLLLDLLARLGVVPDAILLRGIAPAWVMHGSAGAAVAHGYRAADQGWSRMTAVAGAVDRLADDAALSEALDGFHVVTATPLAVAPSAATRVHRLQSRTDVLELVADLYCDGVAVDWQGLHAQVLPPDPAFPRTGFERRKLKSPRVEEYLARSLQPAPVRRLLQPPQRHPGSVGYRLDLTSPWLTLLSQHRLGGRRIAPASLLIELMREAGADALDRAAPSLVDLEFLHPVDIDQHGRDYLVQVSTAETPARVTLCSRLREQRGNAGWTRHTAARVACADAAAGPAPRLRPIGDLPAEQALDVDALYAQHQASRVELGPAFRCLRGLRRGEGRVQAELALTAQPGADALTCTTLLLDGCFQASAALRDDPDRTYLLASIGEAHLAAALPQRVYADIRVLTSPSPAAAGRLLVDIYVSDRAGEPLARFLRVGFSPVDAAPPDAVDAAAQLYTQRWTALPAAADSTGYAAALRLDDALEQVAARESLVRLGLRHGLDEYDRYRAEAETVCLELAAAALLQRGWPRLPGERIGLPERLHELGIVEAQQRLAAHLTAALGQAGYLVAGDRDGEWSVCRPLPTHGNVEALLQAFPPFAGETRFIQRCGAALADVLGGRRDPLDVLFSSEALQGSEAIYLTSPISRVLNEQLARIAAELGRSGVPLRILEIGAGTGGTSRSVLSALAAQPPQRYCYTDVSPLFLDRARAQFGDYDFVDYQRLDIEQTPASQGFAAASFDIVIAANVLHATRAIGETLDHVAQLLAPGGCLLLRECIRPQLSADISFGMTSGWWRFDDAPLRRDSALLSAERWCAQLSARGFAAVQALTPSDAAAEALIVAQAPLTARPQRWLVAHAGQAAARDLLARLARTGDSCRELCWDSAAPSALAESFAGAALDHVVYFPHLAAASADAAGDARQLYEHFIGFCRAHADAAATRNARLWCVTARAEAVTAADDLAGLAQSVLAGVVKCAALEFPARIGGVVDLQQHGDESAALLQQIRQAGPCRYLALRDGQVYLPQLWPCTAIAAPAAVAAPRLAQAAGAVLISGGFGGIGYAVASALSRRGPATLILVGRDADSAENQARLARLRDNGAIASGHCVDIGDSAQVAALFEALRAQGIEVGAVLHAAGVGGDQPLAQIRPGDGRTVVGAKLDGTWNLHRYADAGQLRAFVVLSTMLSLWGARDKTHYVLANHFADRVVHYRRSRGLPAQSLQLGPVDGGMLGAAGRSAAERVGVGVLAVQRVIELLLDRDAPAAAELALLDVDWARFKPIYRSTWLGTYFDPVGTAALPCAAAGGDVADDDSRRAQDFVRRYAAASAAERDALLEAVLMELLRDVLGLSGSAARYRNTGFHDLGMDSLLTLAFAARLARCTGVAVSSIDVFDNATLANLQRWLARQLRGNSAASAPRADASSAQPPAESAPDNDAFEQELLAMEELLRE